VLVTRRMEEVRGDRLLCLAPLVLVDLTYGTRYGWKRGYAVLVPLWVGGPGGCHVFLFMWCLGAYLHACSLLGTEKQTVHGAVYGVLLEKRFDRVSRLLHGGVLAVWLWRMYGLWLGLLVRGLAVLSWVVGKTCTFQSD